MRHSSQLYQGIAVLIGIAAAFAFLVGIYFGSKRTKESYNPRHEQPVVLDPSSVTKNLISVNLGL